MFCFIIFFPQESSEEQLPAGPEPTHEAQPGREEEPVPPSVPSSGPLPEQTSAQHAGIQTVLSLSRPQLNTQVHRQSSPLADLSSTRRYTDSPLP
jgi:hypothetical protein